MREVSITEARVHLYELIRQVESGEEIIITKGIIGLGHTKKGIVQ